MEDNKELFECQECGAVGGVTTDMDIEVVYCPFCGEALDNIDWDEDYENFNSESEGT
jgi:Zn finger protein HypA/HybF involved in hydrogenase expression